MDANVIMALGMMWKGMFGIFVVIGLLALVVFLLSKMGETANSGKRPARFLQIIIKSRFQAAANRRILTGYGRTLL